MSLLHGKNVYLDEKIQFKIHQLLAKYRISNIKYRNRVILNESLNVIVVTHAIKMNEKGIHYFSD